MHSAKWVEGEKTEIGWLMAYSYQPEVPYNACQLVEDLLEAGVDISEIHYEEDADVGMKYFGGDLSVKEFIDQFPHLRNQGMGGMFFDISCAYQGSSFSMGMVGTDHSEVTITIPKGNPITAEQILRLLQKA